MVEVDLNLKFGTFNGIMASISGQSILEFSKLCNQDKSLYCLLNSKVSILN